MPDEFGEMEEGFRIVAPDATEIERAAEAALRPRSWASSLASLPCAVNSPLFWMLRVSVKKQQTTSSWLGLRALGRQRWP